MMMISLIYIYFYHGGATLARTWHNSPTALPAPIYLRRWVVVIVVYFIYMSNYLY